MRTALSLAAAAFLAAGCNKSPEGGPAPGTKNSFTLTLPTTTTTIKQGTSETVKITVNPGSDFKETVKLKVDPPAKVDAKLSKDSVAPGDPKEVTLTLTVDKDAATGEQGVKVTGTPGNGAPTAENFKIKIETP